jgi:hypothetical protein
VTQSSSVIDLNYRLIDPKTITTVMLQHLSRRLLRCCTSASFEDGFGDLEPWYVQALAELIRRKLAYYRE